MKYRQFGNTDIKLSALGFGTMRLPIINDDNEKINEKEAIRIIRHAIDNGINYVDTAFMYHGGLSEGVVAKALKDGYREKVYIADKLAMWGCNNIDDLKNVFETQLKRLEVDSIDFYLVHSLNSTFWDQRDKLQFIEYCDQLKKDGKIKFLGFSYHDSEELFEEIADAYDWDFCQIQYNYLNENVQAGTKGLEYAASKGLPVMIMEPLLGGMLSNPPEAIKGIFEEAQVNPTDVALKWLWNRPEVTVVLSGMSSMEQVEKNLKSADESGVGTLDKKSKDIIAKSVATFKKFMEIPCTKCNYCTAECPKGISIPLVFEYYNFHSTFSVLYYNMYAANIPAEKNASQCIQCGKCEKKCPQGIKISELMPKAHARLTTM